MRGFFWRTELSTLAAVGLLAVGVYAFIEIADDVIEGEANRFDEAFLRLLRTRGDLVMIEPQYFFQRVQRSRE